MLETSPTSSPHSIETDVGLARRAADGDHAAFERIMRRYNRQLYRVARATLRDAAEAEDAVQEAYIAAFGAIGRYRGEASLGTWLSRLVMNECLGRLRRATRRNTIVPMVSSDAEEWTPMAMNDTAHSADDAVHRAEMRALIERRLDELPEAFRIVFVLRGVEELSVEETAACLDIPETTVRTRYFRAKALLRAALSQDIDLAERDVFSFGGTHCDRIVSIVMQRLEKGAGH